MALHNSRPRYSHSPTQVDAVSLERENDDAIELMVSKATQLREVADGLHNEVRVQVGMLDRIGDSTTGVNDMLKSSVNKFNKVFSNTENRTLAYVVAGCVFMFLLYLLFFKRR